MYTETAVAHTAHHLYLLYLSLDGDRRRFLDLPYSPPYPAARARGRMFWVDGARHATGSLKCLATCLLALASPRRSSSAAGIAAGGYYIRQPPRRLAFFASNSSLLCSRRRMGGYVRHGNVLQGRIRLVSDRRLVSASSICRYTTMVAG